MKRIAPALQSVRVTFKDYGLFIPINSAGATAVLEGVFTVTTVPEATTKPRGELI